MKLLAVNIPTTYFNTGVAYQPNSGWLQTAQVADVISKLLPNIIVAAGIIFFFLILFGGFSLVVGAGKNQSPQEAAKGKAAITYGVVGFLLVISAYFILQIISLAVTGNASILGPGP